MNIDSISLHKTVLSLKILEIIQSVFSDKNGIKVEINSGKIAKKSLHNSKFKNILINNTRVKENQKGKLELFGTELKWEQDIKICEQQLKQCIKKGPFIGLNA